MRSPPPAQPADRIAGPADGDALLAGLRSTLRDAVATALDGAVRVAMVDYPNHTNVGDHAIWAGARALLAELGVEVAYVADHASYSARRLRRRTGRGPVLLHGGGSFGDVWPAFQAFRERVVADGHDRRVVVLPQSIEFRDPVALGRARQVLGAHPDLVLVARDATSRAFAVEHFAGARVLSAPDTALMLDLERPAPSVDVVWLSRTDAERTRAAVGEELDVATVDWTGHAAGESGWTPAYQRLHALTWNWGRRARRYPRLWPLLYPGLARGYERLAQERVGVGVELLGRSRVVVTDRLHAHILSLLMGIPHVVLDTGYGKLDRFIAAWTADSPLLHRAGSWTQAAELAGGLVGEPPA